MTLRILLVDDSPADRKVLRATLAGAWPDATFTDAEDAESALEALRARTFDVVVSDHHMPGMTGVELLAIARREQPDALRLLVTGAAQFEVALDAANKAKVHGLLDKDLGPAAVRARLQALLATRR